jgi:hypothetical protein
VSLDTGWFEHRVAVEVEDITANDKLLTAWQNTQQGLGSHR